MGACGDSDNNDDGNKLSGTTWKCIRDTKGERTGHFFVFNTDGTYKDTSYSKTYKYSFDGNILKMVIKDYGDGVDGYTGTFDIGEDGEATYVYRKYYSYFDEEGSIGGESDENYIMVLQRQDL